jgi:hypothetical protein
MAKRNIIAMLLFGSLTACGELWKTTLPHQTALDQILLSTAADRAATSIISDKQGKMIANLGAKLGKTFIEAKNFTTEQQQYGLHAIRSRFIDAGVVLVNTAKEADTIVEVAAGALSVDNNHSLVGIPAMGLPIPFAGTLDIPEVPLYKKETNRGLAKFSVSLRDAHTGKAKVKSFFTVGTAKIDSWEILIFFKRIENDLYLPNEYKTAVSPSGN